MPSSPVKLSDYELKRLANIKRNQSVLASLEIPDVAAEAAKARAEKRKLLLERKAQRAREAPREARSAKLPSRASSRQAGKPALFVPSMDDGMSDAVKKARAQYLELPNRPRPRKKKQSALVPLTEQQRKALSRATAQAAGWLHDFANFLEHTLGDSEQNRRQVIIIFPTPKAFI